MRNYKKLASQTAIYGLPGILGRFLNYLLVPLYTSTFVPSEYGVVNDVYALVAFVAVILPWGMETAYFRFSTNKNFDPEEVFQTSLFFVFLSSSLFISGILLFTNEVAHSIGYPGYSNYVVWMGLALVFDALSVVPMAKLRKEEKTVQFATANFISIATNIGLNVFFIGYCMQTKGTSNNKIIEMIFDPSIGVGYIFIANMIQAIVKFILVMGAYRSFRFQVNKSILFELIKYSSPLVVAGFAGIINETLDRRLIRILLEPKIGTTKALAQVGIYGGVYKLSLLITLFTQAFRYAAEPFFFKQDHSENPRKVYATVLKWYTIVVSTLFLLVLLYLDIFKLFLGDPSYWKGLSIVPILLLANIFLGWVYNLSIWYKLSHQTLFGALIAVIGAGITIMLNIILVPSMGYAGSAWATLAAYGSMAIISYFLSRKYYPIPYHIPKTVGYVAIAVGIWWTRSFIDAQSQLFSFLLSTIAMLSFICAILAIEYNEIKKLFGPQK